MQVWFSCPEIEAILRLGDNDVFNHPECANDVGGDDGVQARGHVQTCYLKLYSGEQRAFRLGADLVKLIRIFQGVAFLPICQSLCICAKACIKGPASW